MKHKSILFITLFVNLIGETVVSQDVSRFSSDKNKFSVGFELSGAFPVGSFSNTNISFPCNSTVSAASAFELTMGYKINSKFGGILALTEGFYPLDPSSSGVSELLNEHPGLYQSATVSKSGQLTARSIMIGGYYDYPLNKTGKIFSRSKLMLGLMSCSIPEIEVQGYHNPGTPDKNGNSIDTIESWDTPSIYAYSFSFRLDEGVYYVLNKNLEFFINLHYQVGDLSYPDITVNYNLSVNNDNSVSGTTTTLSSNTHQSVVSPFVLYQAISLGLGCEVRF